MRFSTILASLLGASYVFCLPVQNPLGLAYTIEEYPEKNEVIDIYNGDSITLTYTVANDNEQPATIIGVGGSFKDPNTNEVSTNLTTGNVGPIVLEQGQSQQFKQLVELNLIPGNYILAPIVYVVVEEQLVQFEAETQLASVSDRPISFFNPQLLFLELILVGTIGLVGYFGYLTFGKPYFKKVAPVKKPNKVARASSPETAKSYDSSWIPENHLNRKTKKNTKS